MLFTKNFSTGDKFFHCGVSRTYYSAGEKQAEDFASIVIIKKGVGYFTAVKRASTDIGVFLKRAVFTVA